MDENRINETEIETEVAENIETTEKSGLKEVKESKKHNKPKKIKNQFLIKKGGYSIAITAIVLVGIIVFNVLIGVLSQRFVLEYDFSKEKKNSLSTENINYIKNVKRDVSVTVCADKESYADMLDYVYGNQYNFTESPSEYYSQTLKIIDKYSAYNKKIDLNFVDPNSNEFSKIQSEYSDQNLSYGDIIVSSTKNETTRTKVVKYTDVYLISEDDTYAAYGQTTASVTGNNIENALTGAISYVLSDKTKRIGFITGHSTSDITADYKTLLSDNNYEIVDITDKIVTSISNDLDGVVIAAPTTDFLAEEIKAMNEFLDNDSKLGKGIIFFADASSPYLENLYDFLEDWGIAIEEGVVLETNEQNYMPDEPTTIGSYSTGKDDMTSDMTLCITGNNIPITASFETRDSLTVIPLMATPSPESAIAAPKGSGAGFSDADSYEKKIYDTAIMTQKLEYLDGTNEAKSFVCAFSSASFIASEYNESSSVSNKNLTLAVAEKVCGGDSSDISFVTKSIESESFAASVTQGASNTIVIIFMILLPISMIATGIFVFIKRRNS